MKFLSPEVALYLYKSAYSHAWNSVVMSGLVLLVATWNCWISYKNGYVEQLVSFMLQGCLCQELFSCTARLLNSLHIEYFPLTCDLNGFKPRF